MGKEVVLVNSQSLTTRLEIGQYQTTKEFTLAQVRDLRTSKPILLQLHFSCAIKCQETLLRSHLCHGTPRQTESSCTSQIHGHLFRIRRLFEIVRRRVHEQGFPAGQAIQPSSTGLFSIGQKL
jgi:hypothetical protein